MTISGASFTGQNGPFGAFSARQGSRVLVTDGSSTSAFSTDSGSDAAISGGAFTSFIGFGESTITGGSFDRLHAKDESQLELLGTEFMLDAESIDGLSISGDILVPDTRDGALLTSIFSDGLPFDLMPNSESGSGDFFDPNATLRLTLVSALDLADLNGDGFVDGLDLGTLLGNFEQNGIAASGGELSGTDPVDGLDLGILLGAWNPPLQPPATSVPEPCALALAGLAAIGLFARRGQCRS